MGAVVGIFIFGLLVIVGIAFYFLPAIIALARQHRNTTAIFVLNFLAGWTLLGWIIAIVWAFINSPSNSKSSPDRKEAGDFIRAEIIKAEDRIDGVVADKLVVAQGLEEWLRARGWQRDYAKFGTLDWYSPRHGVTVRATEDRQPL